MTTKLDQANERLAELARNLTRLFPPMQVARILASAAYGVIAAHEERGLARKFGAADSATSEEARRKTRAAIEALIDDGHDPFDVAVFGMSACTSIFIALDGHEQAAARLQAGVSYLIEQAARDLANISPQGSA